MTTKTLQEKINEEHSGLVPTRFWRYLQREEFETACKKSLVVARKEEMPLYFTSYTLGSQVTNREPVRVYRLWSNCPELSLSGHVNWDDRIGLLDINLEGNERYTSGDYALLDRDMIEVQIGAKIKDQWQRHSWSDYCNLVRFYQIE